LTKSSDTDQLIPREIIQIDNRRQWSTRLWYLGIMSGVDFWQWLLFWRFGIIRRFNDWRDEVWYLRIMIRPYSR
jgi:hypothetical protein